jgi:hypothetical protein
MGLTTDNVHAVLAQESLHGKLTEDDALVLMTLFHMHHVECVDAILEDRPSVTGLDAITQRHAARVVASVWPDRNDVLRTDYRHWYYEFNTRIRCATVDDLPPEWAARVNRLLECLRKHPLIKGITRED